jgi:hypothetical protein
MEFRLQRDHVLGQHRGDVGGCFSGGVRARLTALDRRVASVPAVTALILAVV